MQSEPEPTKWEHFVPRVYYKGFSEIKRKRTKEILLAWATDVKLQDINNRQIDINDFCAENNLYELRNEEGEFIARNYIEKKFSRIEQEVGVVLNEIIEKAKNERCLECTSVLSEYDKSILIILITMILFRDPETISYGVRFLQQGNPEMDEREARNFTLMNLIPMGIDPEWDKNTIIRTAIEKYSGMEFQIGVAPDDVIITSDRPVIERKPDKNEIYNRPRAVMFPLSSRLCLYLFPVTDQSRIGRSSFFVLSDAQISDIQINIAVCARRWIFSREELTKEQRERIKEGRRRLEY